MSFVTPMLLAGVALAAIPIVLHLVMRRQPRELIFPAVRFVQKRRESNRRRMQLRHWLLLAMRCLLIAALAAALARPLLRDSSLGGKEGAPLALAAVVDNSLRMTYVHQNRTRLEVASEMAAGLVAKLPEESMVAAFDLGRAASGFAPDLSAAAARLERLRPTAAARPLASAVVEAIGLVAQQADRRQEVVVLTDMTVAAWNDEARAAVAAALEAAPDVRLTLVDVGVRSPQNAALGPIETRRRVLRVGESLRLAVDVSAPAGGSPPLVELLTQDDEGRLQKRREALVEIDAEGRGRATFDLANLPLGTHQGAVQLAAADPLPADNTRYFTVEVRPPARVLLLAEDARAARFVREALAPSTGAASARFEVETGALADVSAKSFDEYQAVVLLDPGPIGEDVWLRLGDYVAAGGGLGVILGHQAVGHAAAFNGPAAQRLLPGKLARNSRDATYLRPRRLDHPALAGLRNYEEDIPWTLCRVYRYWQLDDVAGDAYIVATLANDDPAIFDRGVGRGRVLTVTTPFSDPLQPEGREPWNVFASPEVAWPFVALCDQLIGYLSRDAEERLDYLAGETARVRLSPREQVTSFVVRTPDGQASSRVGGGDELSVSGADELGNYRLTAGGRSQRLDRGFSVNAAPDVSLLTRVDAASVVDSLPDNRAVLADDFTATAVSLAAGRSGRELYPWLIGLVAVVWGAEHLLANRFYRSPAPLDGSADK